MNKKQALRFNKDKPKYSYIHLKSFENMVKVLDFGSSKYGKYNWKSGHPVTDICDSLLRHLQAFMDGQDLDEETKLPHYAHMQANLMFLAFVMENKREQLDNRFKTK